MRASGPAGPPGPPPSLTRAFNRAAAPSLTNKFMDAVTGRLARVSRPSGTPKAATDTPRTTSYSGPAIKGPRINDTFNRAARGEPPPTKPPSSGGGEAYGDFDTLNDGPKPPSFPGPR